MGDELQGKRTLKSEDLIYPNLTSFRIRVSSETFRAGTESQHLLSEIK